MKKTENVEVEYVKKTTAVVIAVIGLAVGFFMGIMYSKISAGSGEVRKITVKQPQSQTQSQSSPGGQTGLISTLRREVTANPQNADAWARLGHAYFDSNQTDKAIAAYKKHLELKPGNADVWTDMGIMYRRSEKPDEAIRCFDKAIEINPRHRQSRFNKGIVLMHDLKNPEAAIKAWEELVDIDPDARTQDGKPLKELIEKFRSSSPSKKGTVPPPNRGGS